MCDFNIVGEDIIFPYSLRRTGEHSSPLRFIIYKRYSVVSHPNTTSKIIITQKPMANENVERLLCVPRLASGISSSTTTNSIAPAAKAKRYGIAGEIMPNIKRVSTAKIGSTAPLKVPIKKAFPLLFPCASSGRLTIAPSGKF